MASCIFDGAQMLLEASNARIRLFACIYIILVHEECYAMTKFQTSFIRDFEKLIILSTGLTRALFIILQNQVTM